MATLLHLDSSADLTGSVSRRLTARFAAGWAALGHATVRRDLFLDQPPHLPSNVLHWAPSLRATDESVDPAHDRYQEELVGELLAADVVLVGAPMYNWSVPSTLKAWIDWIHVPGMTAPAGPDDPAPLAGKPIVIASGRGLAYGPDSGNVDHELAALNQLFAQVDADDRVPGAGRVDPDRPRGRPRPLRRTESCVIGRRRSRDRPIVE